MPVPFKITVKIPEGWELAHEAVQKGLKRGVERSVGIVANSAIKKAPRRTGTLRRSIQAREVTRAGGVFLGKVIQDETVASYGKFVEFGTGIYAGHGPITPKTAKVLVWRGRDGKMVFRRSVKGMRQRPYLRPAILDNLGRIKQAVQSSINEAIREVTK